MELTATLIRIAHEFKDFKYREVFVTNKSDGKV
jgi:hypothetical protein